MRRLLALALSGFVAASGCGLETPPGSTPASSRKAAAKTSQPDRLSQLKTTIAAHAWWESPRTTKQVDTIIATLVAGKADDLFRIDKKGGIKKAAWTEDDGLNPMGRRLMWEYGHLRQKDHLNIFLNGEEYAKKLTPEEAATLLNTTLDRADFRSRK